MKEANNIIKKLTSTFTQDVQDGVERNFGMLKQCIKKYFDRENINRGPSIQAEVKKKNIMKGGGGRN